jgi:hypothetical protein
VPNVTTGKPELVSQLLAAKEASGKTFTQIGKEIGRTNLYTTQLFFNQVGNQSSACRRQPCINSSSCGSRGCGRLTQCDDMPGRQQRVLCWLAGVPTLGEAARHCLGKCADGRHYCCVALLSCSADAAESGAGARAKR